jgi:hypothetical protein
LSYFSDLFFEVLYILSIQSWKAKQKEVCALFKYLLPPFVLLLLLGFSIDTSERTIPAENNLSSSKVEHIPYTIRVYNKTWTKPAYASEWDSPWLKKGLGDTRIKKAIAFIYSHQLFMVPMRPSERIEFYSISQIERNEQGKFPKQKLSSDHVGFYVFGAVITDVQKDNNGIGFIVKPTHSGYQEVWLPTKYLSQNTKYKVMTPDGYVLDQMPYTKGN